jgi:hypothetical protein
VTEPAEGVGFLIGRGRVRREILGKQASVMPPEELVAPIEDWIRRGREELTQFHPRALRKNRRDEDLQEGNRRLEPHQRRLQVCEALQLSHHPQEGVRILVLYDVEQLSSWLRRCRCRERCIL